MATRTGSVGSSGGTLNFASPVSIGITLGTNEYPNGTISLDDIKQGGAFWRNNRMNAQQSINLFLCDSAGNNKVLLFNVQIPANSTVLTPKSATINAPALAGKALYLIAEGDTGYVYLRNATAVTVQTAVSSYSITCQVSGGGGSLSASKSSAGQGEQITLYPSPNTGYQLASLTANTGTGISNNKFTMPASNITITATFSKVSYGITRQASPSGGGTVTTKKSGTSVNSANYGDTIAVSQTPATGYYFNGWTTSPANLISSGQFTMPAQAVTVTANYLKRSTASLASSALTGGSTVRLTISPDKSAYSHKYRLYFASGMDTGWVNVAAGTTAVDISIPSNWSNQIPNDTQKTGGWLQVDTYSGSTNIGSYTISSLTFNVPASAVPGIGTITNSIVRGTFANVGEYYVQNKSYVRTQTTASGAAGSSITSLKVQIGGYTGSNYVKTVSAASIDFTSGLLTIAGSTTITVTATDSRGRTVTKTATITVTAYAKPSGSIDVWRVDGMGVPSAMGDYAKYSLTANYTNVGTNTLTKTLKSQNTTASSPPDTGDILPGTGGRQTFSLTAEYTIELTLADAFETVTITAKLPTGQYIWYADETGTHLAFMKAATKTTPAGKAGTIEFPDNFQIYIGDTTLEDYIRSL